MKEISKAIGKVMEDVQWVWKSLTVWSWNNSYKWVSDKDVKEIIRESMIKNWLSILPVWVTPKIQVDRWEEVDSWSKETPKAMKTKQSIFTEVETKYILLHTSWESIEVAGYGQGVDTQDKWAGKATTYALKNVLLNMFLVPTWIDTDTTHSDDLPVPQKQVSKKYFNYEDLIETIDAGNVTAEEIKKVIKEDGFTVSKYATDAIQFYLETGEVNKNLFYKQAN